MAQLRKPRPMFGPKVEDERVVILPPVPANISPPLAAAISRYRTSFFSKNGRNAAAQTTNAAYEIARMPACSHADMAAKLILGLHESHPALKGDQLAVDAGSFETDASGRVLLSVVHDLLTAASGPDRMEWEKVEAEYHKAWALWDDLGDNYTNEESDAVAAVAFPAMERMMDTPAPDAEAMLMKMIAAREGGRIVNEDDMDALVADARRFAGVRPASADPRWAPSLSAYLAAKAAEDVYDRDVHMPAFDRWSAAVDQHGKGHVPDADLIPDDVAAEIDRLQSLRHDAEELLIDIPSPNATAFARKFLVARGEGRSADCWDEMLEAEARHFVREGF